MPILPFAPDAWLLRPGGLFAFNHHSPIETICWPLDSEHVGDRLVLDYFGMHRIDDGDDFSFQLPYGEWIRLFRANGFEIEDLIELRPEPDAVSTYRTAEELAWARRWPAECIWRLRLEDRDRANLPGSLQPAAAARSAATRPSQPPGFAATGSRRQERGHPTQRTLPGPQPPHRRSARPPDGRTRVGPGGLRQTFMRQIAREGSDL